MPTQNTKSDRKTEVQQDLAKVYNIYRTAKNNELRKAMHNLHVLLGGELQLL